MPLSGPPVAVLTGLLVCASLPIAIAAQAQATAVPRDTDGDTLPDLLERRAGLDPRERDVLSYVGGADCSDGRPPSAVRSPKRTWCGLARAAEAAPAGSTVLVRAGVYDRFTVSRTPRRRVRLVAYPGEAAVLRGADVSGARIRLERFRITGTVNLVSGARRVSLVANRWITDGRSGGTNLNIEAGVQGVLVERNRIRQRPAVRGANAINFSSTDTRPPIKRVTIRDNRIGPMRGGGDAIQAKNTRDLLVEDNEIFGLSRPAGSAAHPDAFQSIYGAVRLTLRRNFIHDIAAQGVFVQAFRGPNLGFRAHDNVIARVAYPWVAFTFATEDARVVHNTIGGLLRVNESTSRAAIVANVANTLLFEPGAQVRRAEYNLAQRFIPRRGRRSIRRAPRYRRPSRNDFRLRRGSPGWRKAPGGRDIGSRRANWSTRK
jgi:hypothetical protein